MSSTICDPSVFWPRLKRLTDALKAPGGMDGAEALVVGIGAAHATNEHLPAGILSKYLLGVMFPDTLIVVTPTAVAFVASKSKIEKHLSRLDKHPDMHVELLLRVKPKKSDGAGLMEDLARFQLTPYKSRLGGFALPPVPSGDQSLLPKAEREDPATSAPFVMKNVLSKEFGGDVAYLDVAEALEVRCSPKSASELVKMEMVGEMLGRCMRKVFKKHLFAALNDDDAGKKHTPAELQAAVRAALSDPKQGSAGWLKGMKKNKAFAAHLELCVEGSCAPTPPVQVQCGASGFSSKRAPTTSEVDATAALSYDVVVSEFGMSYGGFHGRIARTHFFNATPTMERAYRALERAMTTATSVTRPGTTPARVYELVKQQIPKEFQPYFAKTIGYGIGRSGAEMGLQLSASNASVTIEGETTFCVRLCLDNIPLPAGEVKASPDTALDGIGKTFSVRLADTVRVLTVDVAGTETYVDALTKYYTSALEDVNAELLDEDAAAEEAEAEAAAAKHTSGTAAGAVAELQESSIHGTVHVDLSEKGVRTRGRRKTPQQQAREAQSAQRSAQMAERQKSKMMAKMEAYQAKLAAEAAAGPASGGKTLAERQEEERAKNLAAVPVAFKSVAHYPAGDLKKGRVHADLQHDSVFLPIYGVHVPFHISTIKTVSKTDSDAATFLRLTFHTPSAKPPKTLPASMATVFETYPQLAFVKEMSFRSTEDRNLAYQLRMIKEMQKRYRERSQRSELADEIYEENEPFKMYANRPADKKATLKDVMMRPGLGRGKTLGTLQAHANAFRYRSTKNQVLDIFYSNIQHMFFQPSLKELIVLVHFRLKQPIALSERTTTQDVQFYTEVTEGSSALDRGNYSHYDPDETMEEDREAKMRRKLDRAFLKFAKQSLQIAELHDKTIGADNDLEEVTNRALGFSGVPHKEMVFLQPTVHCIVNLTETPFTVVSLDDLEHVHFERVDVGGSKNFDAVFISKKQCDPLSKDVPQRITAIPIESLETMKAWIDEKEYLTFTTGSTALSWPSVMLGVRDELEKGVFWSTTDSTGRKKDVGWNFLSLEEVVDEATAQARDDADGDSDFDVGNEDDDDFSEVTDSEDSDIDLVEESDYNEDEYVEMGSDESEGEDWDEMERKALRADRKREARDMGREGVKRSRP